MSPRVLYTTVGPACKNVEVSVTGKCRVYDLGARVDLDILCGTTTRRGFVWTTMISKYSKPSHSSQTEPEFDISKFEQLLHDG